MRWPLSLGSFLLTRAKAEELRTAQEGQSQTETKSTETTSQEQGSETEKERPSTGSIKQPVPGRKATLRLKGTVSPEVWNRFGTRILPKLRSGDNLSVSVEFLVNVDAELSHGFQLELEQALMDLGLQERVSVEHS